MNNLKGFILPPQEDEWRTWKIDPIGNTVAMICLIVYTSLAVVMLWDCIDRLEIWMIWMNK